MQLLQYLSYKKEFSVQDRIILVNYLLCQDRIQEATEQHSLIDPLQVTE